MQSDNEATVESIRENIVNTSVQEKEILKTNLDILNNIYGETHLIKCALLKVFCKTYVDCKPYDTIQIRNLKMVMYVIDRIDIAVHVNKSQLLSIYLDKIKIAKKELDDKLLVKISDYDPVVNEVAKDEVNDQIKLKIKTLKSTIQCLKELGVEIGKLDLSASIKELTTITKEDLRTELMKHLNLDKEIRNAIELQIKYSDHSDFQPQNALAKEFFNKSKNEIKNHEIDILKGDTIPVKPEKISKKQEEKSKFSEAPKKKKKKKKKAIAESLQRQDLHILKLQEVEEESKEAPQKEAKKVEEESKHQPKTWVGQHVQQQCQQQQCREQSKI